LQQYVNIFYTVQILFKLDIFKLTVTFIHFFYNFCVQVEVQVKNLVVPHYYKNTGALQLSHKNDVICSQTPGKNKKFSISSTGLAGYC